MFGVRGICRAWGLLFVRGRLDSLCLCGCGVTFVDWLGEGDLGCRGWPNVHLRDETAGAVGAGGRVVEVHFTIALDGVARGATAGPAGCLGE